MGNFVTQARISETAEKVFENLFNALLDADIRNEKLTLQIRKGILQVDNAGNARAAAAYQQGFADGKLQGRSTVVKWI